MARALLRGAVAEGAVEHHGRVALVLVAGGGGGVADGVGDMWPSLMWAYRRRASSLETRVPSPRSPRTMVLRAWEAVERAERAVKAVKVEAVVVAWVVLLAALR